MISMHRVKRVSFSEVDLNDSFFDSLKKDYLNFVSWFGKKLSEPCYICGESGNLEGFLYLKKESSDKDFMGIRPPFDHKSRLKIGTFKVAKEGVGIGKKFLTLAVEEALRENVDELYVTVLPVSEQHKKFIRFIRRYHFSFYGCKGDEKVFILPSSLFEHTLRKIKS